MFLVVHIVKYLVRETNVYCQGVKNEASRLWPYKQY